MIWGALIGCLVFLSISNLRETFRHKGSGINPFNEERSEIVSEAVFKQNGYTMGGFLLLIAIFFWFCVAHSAKDKRGD